MAFEAGKSYLDKVLLVTFAGMMSLGGAARIAAAPNSAAVTSEHSTSAQAGSEALPAAEIGAEKSAAPQRPSTTGSWPKTLEDAKSEVQAKNKPPPTWTSAEIADAQARCSVILKRIHAVAIQQAPIREGECGTPAPIQLISIGSKPEVAISPPAIITCEMAESLNTWLEHDLQPLARKEFGADIIKIETMSDYSCRNAYGRAKNKLSEHGRANALDIRGFITSSAKTAYVLEGWGKPQREILAEIAAAKAAAAKAAAAKAQALAAEQANQKSAKSTQDPVAPQATASTALGSPAAGIVKSTIVDGTPRLTVTLPGAQPASSLATPTFAVAPDKLGGPNDRINGVQAANGGSVSRFLHAAHDAACQIFGTTLGPEANDAHRNHFHVDMAERKLTRICD